MNFKLLDMRKMAELFGDLFRRHVLVYKAICVKYRQRRRSRRLRPFKTSSLLLSFAVQASE
jgi:hypothetical protein